jgi:hypothetical protein
VTTIEDQTAATLAAVARFSSAFDRQDVDGVMAAMSADCRFESTGPAPDGEAFVGTAAVRRSGSASSGKTQRPNSSPRSNSRAATAASSAGVMTGAVATCEASTSSACATAW